MGQIANATAEQRTAGQSVITAIAATTEQAKLIAAATAEQAATATGVVKGTGQMRKNAQEVAKAITDAMVKITNTTPEATIVIFDDVAKENWAQAGVLASET